MFGSTRCLLLGSLKSLTPTSIVPASSRSNFQSARLISSSPAIAQAQGVFGLLSRVAKVDDAALPERPKKPRTPWLSFVRDRKDEILGQKQGMTAAELAVILSKEWKTMDRTRYEEEYRRNHEMYLREVENYKNSLTPEHLETIEAQKDVKRDLKAIKQIRKTNPPVLPRNAANLYVQERCKQPDIKLQLEQRKSHEVFSDIFKEYRSKSDDEKRKYYEMQEDDKVRFQQEFLSWYESVQNNELLSKTAREHAHTFRERMKALKYI